MTRSRELRGMASAYIQANTNGRLHDAAEPGISPLDRSYLYGDSVYEVWRTVNGVAFAFEEHFSRLEASAGALWFEVPLDRESLLLEMRRTCEEFISRTGWRGDLYIRLQLSRGAGPIGLDTALADQSSFVLLVQTMKEVAADVLERGVKLSIAQGLRRNPAVALNPAWKTGNYLNNLLCLREARARGADEVVILNLAGEVTEAAVSNLLFVRDSEVVTPPLSAGILPGVTRRLLIEKVGPAAGVAIKEEVVRPSDLAGFSECGMTSTTKDITPVASIDSHTFERPEEGVLAKLKKAFGTYMNDYARAHPEFRVA